MISGQTQLLPWLDVLQDRVHHQETAVIFLRKGCAIALTFALNERAAVLTPVAMTLALLQVPAHCSLFSPGSRCSEMKAMHIERGL